MLEVVRIEEINKPDVIQKLGNNTYYYNYDIQPIKMSAMTEDEEDTLVDGYSFIQVHLAGQPSYVNCVKAIIRLYVDETQEFDLINSANAYTLELGSTEEDINKYKEYIELVSQIKAKVKQDMAL